MPRLLLSDEHWSKLREILLHKAIYNKRDLRMTVEGIREPWSSYNLQGKYLKIIDSKGRGGKKRPHFVPLSARALQVLEQVRALQPQGAVYPWSIDGQTPIHPSSLSHAVSEWFATEHAKLDGQPVPKFTPRDIRRTCTQFMQRNGIKDFDSDALQSHGQTGVVEMHYRNNPEAKLPDHGGFRCCTRSSDR